MLKHEVIDPVARVRRINRTWFTRGELAANTAAYLDMLTENRPEVLGRVCRKALDTSRRESAAGRDPKPAFYASLFSEATREERDRHLRDHFWTRLLSAEMQHAPQERPGGA